MRVYYIVTKCLIIRKKETGVLDKGPTLNLVVVVSMHVRWVKLEISDIVGYFLI